MKKTHRITNRSKGYIRPHRLSDLGTINPYIRLSEQHQKENTKTINGKLYVVDSIHKYKSDAQKSAEIIREMGYHARIFPIIYPVYQDGKWYYGRYAVYSSTAPR